MPREKVYQKIYVRLNTDPFNSPHYLFSYTANGEALNSNDSNLVLFTGHNYTFIRTDDTHPFDIGDSYNVHSDKIEFTEHDSGIVKSEKFSFSIPNGNSDFIIKYYCTLHSSMIGTIDVCPMVKIASNSSEVLSEHINKALEIANDIILTPRNYEKTEIQFLEVEPEEINGSLGEADWINRYIKINKHNRFMIWNNPITLNSQEYSINIIVILHEMFHILGIGLHWGKDKIGQDDSLLLPDWWYNGMNAVKRYQGLCLINNYDPRGLENVLPAENDFSAGTKGFHLEEGRNESNLVMRNKANSDEIIRQYPTFPLELNTGFLDYNNYLTNISVAFFEDIGCIVNYNSEFIDNTVPMQTVTQNKLSDQELVNLFNELKNNNDPIVAYLNLPERLANITPAIVIEPTINISIIDGLWYFNNTLDLSVNPSFYPTLIIETESMMFTGFGGCNHYSGAITLFDSIRMELSNIILTQMFCEETSNDENQYISNLGSVRTWRLEDDSLILSTSSNHQIRYS